MESIIQILTAPFALIAYTVTSASDGIQDEDSGRAKLMYVLAMLQELAAAIMFVFCIVTFINAHGFTNQINIIKELGVFGASKKIWTAGNVFRFYTLWIVIAVGAVFLLITLSAIIDLYKEGTIGQKIGGTLCIIICAVTGTPYILLKREPYKFAKKFSELIRVYDIDFARTAITVIGVVSIVFLVILFKILSGNAEYYVTGILSTVTYFGMAPLLCLIIENLVGLAMFIIVLAFVLIGGAITGTSLMSIDTSSSRSSSGGGGSSASKKRLNSELAAKKSELNKTIAHRDDARKNGYDKTYVKYGGANEKSFGKTIDNLSDDIKDIENKLNE